MSGTILYPFTKDGICDEDKALMVKNAWRGAVAIWTALEKKYLPAYRPRYVPEHIPDSEVAEWLGYEPTRTGAISNPDAMKEVWNLFNDEKVSIVEKIVLGTTFDNVLVRRENIPKVIDAFEAFDKEHKDAQTSLKEQADALRTLLNEDEVSAIGWNQTSVNADDWHNSGGCEVDEDRIEISIPYNFNTGSKHWWLFDEIDKIG